jgi:hypothetical protein
MAGMFVSFSVTCPQGRERFFDADILEQVSCRFRWEKTNLSEMLQKTNRSDGTANGC